jgi:hypothetical protein
VPSGCGTKERTPGGTATQLHNQSVSPQRGRDCYKTSPYCSASLRLIYSVKTQIRKMLRRCDARSGRVRVIHRRSVRGDGASQVPRCEQQDGKAATILRRFGGNWKSFMPNYACARTRHSPTPIVNYFRHTISVLTRAHIKSRASHYFLKYSACALPTNAISIPLTIIKIGH